MSIFHLTTSVKLSKDFKALCLHQCIVALANGMFGLFLPIFLLKEFGGSVYWVIIFYVIGHLLYGLLAPLGAMLMQKSGLKKMMIVARCFNILTYICLYFLHGNPILFAIMANFSLVMFRLLYWVPYHVDLAKFTSGKYRGRQMSYLAALGYLIGIGSPLLAGFLLTQGGFNVLFAIAVVIILVSIFPLTKLSKSQVKFEFSYFQSFKELFKKANKRLRTVHFADGAQGLVGVVIWPIFIYQILEGQYLAVGAITSLVVIGTIVCQLLVGNYTDKFSKRKLIRVGSFVYAFGWMAKMFVVTAFQIFVVGTFHSLGSIVLRTPFNAFSYEQFTDRGTYLDEYTVLREMSINIGRAVMGLALIGLVYLVGIKIAFPIAAMASLLINVF